MERLYEAFNQKLKQVPQGFSRFLLEKINWKHKLLSIQGARGSGKTTLLLQHIKTKFGTPSSQVLFVDMEHLYFSTHTLFDLADKFYKNGGKFLFLDEMHKYPNWSVEIKQIHDTWNDLQLVFTASSMLQIDEGEADLSRRIARHFLPEMSFREYLNISTEHEWESVEFQDILNQHISISNQISNQIRPLVHFRDYLRYGNYPYFLEGREVYPEKLRSTINRVLESDIPAIEKIDFQSIINIKKLLAILSDSVPFKPNISKLAETLGISRNTLLRMLDLLERAHLLMLFSSSTKGIRKLGKPEKLYLRNANIADALSLQKPNIGSIRETFFAQQLSPFHHIEIPTKGDFLVDGQFTFEIGGQGKNMHQIHDIENAYLALDGIETGFSQKIPLWLFGFLY